MKKKITRLKRLLIWSIICVLFGILITSHPEIFLLGKNYTTKAPVGVINLEEEKNAYNKIITKKAIAKEIIKKCELITSEIDLSAQATWNESWGNYEVFEKKQTIYYYGKGIYAVDLSKIKVEDIKIDSSKKQININVPKPSIKTVVIDDSKTIYEDVEKGVLRFGDIKLLPQEHDIILLDVKEKMIEQMKEPSIYNQSLDNSRKATREIIQQILGGVTEDNYEVTVEFHNF